MTNEYKPEGSNKRKTFYTVGIAVAAVVAAYLITNAIITLEDITNFRDLVFELITIFTAIGYGISNLVARNNVEPPEPAY